MVRPKKYPRTVNVNCPHKDRPHAAKGMCRNCYGNSKRKEKYWGDSEYRERIKARNRRDWRRRYAEDPDWNARRQREWRKRHPDTFNFIMARCYAKKLKKNRLMMLLGEIKKMLEVWE